MKQIASILLLLMLAGCTKKDLQFFRHYQKKNPCTVVSVNADKQNADDFFVLKTFNSSGILTHLKMQIRDLEGLQYLYDYDITYSLNKAVFKGSTKVYAWYYDYTAPDDDPYYPPPPFPSLPGTRQEITELKDTRSFEILLDAKSHFPVEVRYVATGESLLKLSYDQRGFLSKVANYNVTTDQRGNILKILTPPETEPYYYGQQLGIYYGYNDRKLAKGTNHYYETLNTTIHPMFSLLEVLDWGPFQPDLERAYATLDYGYGDEYLPVQPTFSVTFGDHRYDPKGNLIGYTFDGEFHKKMAFEVYGQQRRLTRTISWQCGGIGKR